MLEMVVILYFNVANSNNRDNWPAA